MSQPPVAPAGAAPPALLPGPGPVPREALDHPVFFDPAPAVARWHAKRRMIWSRAVSLVLSLVIWGVIWWLNKDNVFPGFWWFLGLSVGLSVALLVLAIVRTVQAKRDIGRLHEGLALGIGRGGLFLDGYLPWERVESLVTRPGGGDRSVRLIVTATTGAWKELPLEWLSHSPSAVDGAVDALSGRRFRIDLAAFDA